MEPSLRRKYTADFITILVFIVFTWSVLLFVLKNVYDIASTYEIRALMVISCFVVGAFATSALVAVVHHLRKNGESVYHEELLNQADGNDI